jgi:hypothetical protein
MPPSHVRLLSPAEVRHILLSNPSWLYVAAALLMTCGVTRGGSGSVSRKLGENAAAYAIAECSSASPGFGMSA